MRAFTGLLAVFSIFLSGPYHMFQTRWPERWGQRPSTRAHSNISVLAAVAVFAHVAPKIR